MSPEEIIAFWGRERLRRYSPEAVQAAVIPQSSKEFLLSVGLPTGPFGATSWNLDGEGLTLPKLPGKNRYRRFGWDEDVPLCLDEGRDGCVVEAATRGNPERFMNSHVEDFGAFLTLWQQFRTLDNGSDREGMTLLKACERKMRRLDPAAFSDEENGWAVILEDLYYQFD